MAETSASLLDRLRETPDTEAWRRLVDVYAPLIQHWLGRQGVMQTDIDDVMQEVFTVVVRRIPEFHRQPRTGAFRRWLRTITVNCLRDFWRAQRIRPQATGKSDFKEFLDQLEDPHSDLSKLWDQEHDHYVTQQLLAIIQPRFEANTWKAFEMTALQGVSPDETAQQLGLTVNAVFIAKSRVLSALRQEGEGLIE